MWGMINDKRIEPEVERGGAEPQGLSAVKKYIVSYQ